MPAQLSRDPFTSEGFKVLESEKLYRRQDRPWSFIPTGASIRLRAPAGITEADLYRAATCLAGGSSPLAVQGAKLLVTRRGDTYVLRITADDRAAALEIQHRAEAL